MPMLVIAALLTLFGVMPAAGQALYDHNGSQMRLVEDGTTLRIFYEQPRPGIAAVGVRPGTLLFEGTLDDNLYLEGMTRIFSARCGEIDYYVYGRYVRGGSFTLNGAAPVLEQGSYRIVDNVYEGDNANLVFAYRGPAPSSGVRPRPPAPKPASGFGPFCVTGISSSLNLRAGPGTEFSVVGALPANQCGIAGYNRCDGGWCFVASGAQLGWVSGQFLAGGR